MSYRIPSPLKILFLGLFCMLAGRIQAQGTLGGQVINAIDGQPLAGAQIILGPSGKGTLTDERGRFVIQRQAGDTRLTINFLGYATKQIELGQGDAPLGILVLERSNTTLDEVVVSASAKNFKDEFVGSNHRIGPMELKNRNPLATEEILRTVPGVNIVGDMGLSNRPNISIRGSWGRRSKKVLLLEDGSPLAPAPYIAPGAYYNPVSDRLTAIEVYKGADLLKYGPNNMYGAVNYITALPPQKPTLRLKLTGGENGYASGLFSYGGNWGNTAALVEGVYKKFGGHTDNSSVEVLNLNAKVYAQLSGTQSLYFKVSGQFEDNQATLSSQTPFTFEADPFQNPLDADAFTMRRYGVDIIHKWLPKEKLALTTKVYASDFERDWWRQITTKVLASGVRAYVGEEIFADRYGYLEDRTFGPEDYVIVGRVVDGRESTTDSRWIYRVSGLKGTLEQQWEAFGRASNFELGLNVHRETFKDVLLQNNNSRWARNGATNTDLWYRLWAANGYLRNSFGIGEWGMVPILRFEHVNMYRQDLLALAQDPDLQGTGSGRETSVYNQFLPGFTLDRKLRDGKLYGSVYQGMIAPSKVFGFLVERGGVVTDPLAGEDITMEPELSWNKELGWRGGLLGNRIQGQLTYFHNASRNFYAAGRNEVFTELGKINVQGLEMALDVKLFESPGQRLHFLGNLTLVHSKVKAGRLEDRDLFSQIVHGSATRAEFIDKVNAHRDAFELYVDRGSGEVPFTGQTLDAADFDAITRSLITFGNGGITDARAPYTPTVNMVLGMNYDLKGFSAGVNLHHVGRQFTEFHNFVNESADGAIGELPAFSTVDAFVNHDFKIGEAVEMTVFVNGKNITDDLYRASRLNRATSGLFAGGFRQIILGANLRL